MSRARSLAGIAVLFCLTLAAADPAPKGADWPAFRGPVGDGIYRGPQDFSAGKDAEFRVDWKIKIGSGYSGVAVVGKHAVTAYTDGASDLLAAFDADSGKELWRFELGPIYVGHDGAHNGPIATPLIADNRVFMLSPIGRFVAVELDSGKLAWSHTLEADYKARPPFYGYGTSPVFAAGLVLLQVGAADAAIMAFDPKTGEKRWSAGADSINFQSPLQLSGGTQVIATGNNEMLAVNAADGTVSWRGAHGITGRGAIALMPVVLDRDRMFLKDDDASALVRRTGSGADSKFETLWKDNGIRNSYNLPVLHDDHIYAYSTRFLTCVNVNDGKVTWRSRAPGDGFLTLAGDQLVIITKEGSLHLVRATPDAYEERAALKLFDDLAWTNPSIANGRIFVRSLGELACVSVHSSAARAAPRVGAEVPAGRFAAFLQEVQAASDKTATIDKFLSGVQEFPLIEGDETVHFIYRGPGQGLAVAGDLFGARQERAMTRIPDTDFFYCTARVEPDARLSYLFLCDYKDIRDARNPRTTESVVLGRDMEMSFGGREPLPMSWFAMPRWKSPEYLEPARELKGRLEAREIEVPPAVTAASKPASAPTEVPKLPLTIYTPPGYEQGEQRYPVAYVHSGKAAIERGALPQCADYLIGAGRVEPMLLVFMDLPPSRDPRRGEQLFLEQVIPYIDRHYRTIATPDGRANIGMGLGALTALATAFDERRPVSKVGVQSPMLFDGFRRTFEPKIPKASAVPLTVYHDWGKYDLRNPHENWDMVAANRTLAKLLSEHGYQSAGGEVHDGTDWASWRTRGDRMLEALFPRQARSS